MPTPIRVGMIDHSGELTSVNYYLEDIAANGSNFPTLFAQTTGKQDIIKAPLILLTKLNLTKTTASIVVEESAASLPAAADAQREWALRVAYVDTVTGSKYRFDIPAPVDAAVPEGTDIVNLDNVLVAAFITAFEANAVSPVGNAVEITGVRLVGRSN